MKTREGNWSPPPKLPREGGFTLIELMVVVTVIGIVTSIAVPNFVSSRINANERVAVATLRSLASAQMQFRALNHVDSDLDGIFEFGSIGELGGSAPLRGTAGELLTPPLMGRSLTLNGSGYYENGGYLFALYMPDPSGAGVDTNTSLGSVDPALSASYWCCVAWPLSQGASGRSAYFVNQQGLIVKTLARVYSGTTAVPAAGCALVSGNPANITSPQIAAGVNGADGNLWVPVQ